MLKFIIGIFLITPLAVFAQKNNKPFEIRGTIDSLEDGTKLYLNTMLSPSSDSVIVIKGKFRFVGNVSCPTVGVISFGDHNLKAKPFWLENVRIDFKGYGRSLDKSVISGSINNNEELERFYNSMNSLQDNDSKATAFSIAYVKKHPASYLGGIALLIVANKIPVAQLQPLYQGLSSKIRKSFYGEEIEKIILPGKLTKKDNQKLPALTAADTITKDGLTLYLKNVNNYFTAAEKKIFINSYFDEYPALIKKYNSNSPKIIGFTFDKANGISADYRINNSTITKNWKSDPYSQMISITQMLTEIVLNKDVPESVAKANANYHSENKPDTITRNGLTLYYIDLDGSFAEVYKKKLVEAYFEQYPVLIKGYNKKYPKAVTFYVDKNFKGIRSSYQDAVQFGATSYNEDPELLEKIDESIPQDLAAIMQLYNDANQTEPDTVINKNGFTLYLTDVDKSLSEAYKKGFADAYFDEYPKLVTQYNPDGPRTVAFTFDKKNGIKADYKFNYTQNLSVNFNSGSSGYPDNITQMLTDIVLNTNFPPSYRPASPTNLPENKPDTISRNGLTLYFNDANKSFSDAYKKRFVDTYFEQYPKLIKRYNTSSPTALTFNINKNYDGIAVNYIQSIDFNPAWFETNPEDIDVITHELMHSVQGYGYNNVPSWVTEGIADYVRATEGINNKNANWSMPDYNPTQHYDNSYRITARFFVWITQNYKADFVNMLDDASRKQKYNDSTWKNITGKTLDELWQAYVNKPALKQAFIHL